MKDDFETVVRVEVLGGKAQMISEPKLTPEAHEALMSGLNMMGPGLGIYKKPDAADAPHMDAK